MDGFRGREMTSRNFIAMIKRLFASGEIFRCAIKPFEFKWPSLRAWAILICAYHFEKPKEIARAITGLTADMPVSEKGGRGVKDAAIGVSTAVRFCQRDSHRSAIAVPWSVCAQRE